MRLSVVTQKLAICINKPNSIRIGPRKNVAKVPSFWLKFNDTTFGIGPFKGGLLLIL